MKYVLLALALSTFPVLAQDVGVHGDTYPIAEQDFLDFIHTRLARMEKSGELARHQKQLQERAQKSADRPSPVAQVKHTTKPRTVEFDPSITVSRDIPDAQGNILIKRGTHVNPLKQVTLSKALLFYDADVPEQVTWVKKMDSSLNEKTLLILVKGSISEQTQLFQRPVYFDQEGKIAQKIGLQQVPAIVTQQGERLRIKEVMP